MYKKQSLKEALEEKGLTQQDLAKMIGFSPSYVSRLFTASQLTGFKTLAKIEHPLNIKFKPINVVNREEY
ncbi:hypothetical protein SPBRAN_1198 [uncultured Candidatus Thioglobus sp.]|nr:hypothetical protein SPBRAN_1198 [uncultured Candidatus Thioglobus sp.]